MKNKKNIDEFFKKSFENLEASPSTEVWENIQAKLKEEKKDRKIIPLWIKVGSIAAGLALLLSVGNWVFNTSDIVSDSITSEDTIQIDKEGPSQLRSSKQVVSSQETSETSIENQEEASKITEDFDNKHPTDQQGAQSTIASERTSEKRQRNMAEKSQKQTVETLIKKDLPPYKSEENLALEQTKTIERESEGTKKHHAKQDLLSEKEAIAVKDPKTEKVIEAEKKPENKISILDAIAENKKELSEEKSKKESPENRWNVAPVIAPVYYSSLGNGSSIDPDFSNNPQSGDVNMSYGVQVGYTINKRLSIRTGVNNVDLSYSTSGVEVASAPASRGLPSVNYQGKSTVLTVFNSGTVSQNSSHGGDYSNINLKTTAGDTRVIQSINYYEVPVELKYALFDKKFGVNIIGGLSTLFLGNNEISVKSEDFSAVLGEANNLSSVSFSTNIGLGLDYKISKQFIFNIEPMFKYQLNPYTDSSVDFKPYYIGIYSGLNFRF